MTGSVGRLLKTFLLALIVVALGVGLGACGRSDDAKSPPTAEDHVHDGGLPAGTPETAWTEALTTIYSWEPAVDRSPTAALVRAEKYLTGAALADAKSPSTVGPSAQWSTWAADRAIVTAVVLEPQAIDRGDGTRAARATVKQFVQPVSGAATNYRSFIASASLAQVDDEWKIATPLSIEFTG